MQLNKTIITIRRGRLDNLSLFLCEDEVNSAVYMTNRLPYTVINKLTPYEAIYGQPPSFKHLQPSGEK